MTNSNPYAMKADTANFLMSLSTSLMNEILDNIANHYGITRGEAFEEVTDIDAENIMDYITVNRPAVHLLYKQYKLGLLK